MLCVRSRSDPEQKKRLKTGELIVEECPWEPGVDSQLKGRMVALQVAAAELTIRQQVKGAGGKWTPQVGVWELLYEQVVALSLEKRIVPERRSIEG